MNKRVRTALIVLGTACLIFSIVGLIYNVFIWEEDYTALVQKRGLVFFSQTLYVVSGICTAFYVSLAICGVQLLRSKRAGLKFFIWIAVAEIIYSLLIVVWLIIDWLDWLSPARQDLSPQEIGISLATGLSNGGFVIQWFILFPIWGIALSRWCLKMHEADVSRVVSNGSTIDSTRPVKGNLYQVAKQYIELLEIQERTSDPKKAHSLEEERVKLHSLFMDILKEQGIKFNDRDHATRIAYRIANEEL